MAEFQQRLGGGELHRAGTVLQQAKGGVRAGARVRVRTLFLLIYGTKIHRLQPARLLCSTRCHLGKLPREIRNKIWDYLDVGDSEIDITVRMRYHGLVYPPRFRFREIIRLVGVCRQMRTEVFQIIERSVVFVQRSSKFLDESVAHLRGGNMLRRIVTCTWKKIEICDNLPNLVHFQLRTDEARRHNQVRELTRDLLRFGAFLVARHRNLDMLIWPGDSGQPHEPGQRGVVLYIDVTLCKHFRDKWLYRTTPPKYLSKEDWENDDISMVDDRLLNATILRRLHFNDILAFEIDDFVIDRENNATSKIDEGHDYFAQVDNEGYLTRERRQELGKRYVPRGSTD
ncbi:hypothetical protein G647_07641 [Cladophialophora carrionii CBS 160.54]|uniref:F-box domain-containing protein n=1 Tax=Cladophialophora carrionii CBS 160.54 TaxID=1279043 RepID=V9D336_9EURO|nr:uncharacterized protein G647_07641 [Cladophialophora carrionii CBS 160.54]ETI21295.1 hypothetical protein G647_07641 [Cladophialophora carrionii CBS 160.54]